MFLTIAAHALAILLGVAIIVGTLISAIRTFVVPRSISDWLTWRVFQTMRRIFDIITLPIRTYRGRDRIMAFYAPISLLLLPVVWLILVSLAYTAIYWGLGDGGWAQAFTISGSSLLTLGFAAPHDLMSTALVFSEATIGLALIALFLAYLPTIYSAFSRREAAVTALEIRAGSPPSAVEMIKRFYRIHGFDHFGEIWDSWEEWFVELEETHTSLAALIFFRSPRPERSWITAAGTVLDTASLMLSAVDVPREAHSQLCVRAGYVALRYIADLFKIPYNPTPTVDTERISISRAEFDAAFDELAEAGVPIVGDRELAWRDFAGWRVNYDRVLLALANLTMAPYAPWTSDRMPLPVDRAFLASKAAALKR
jgi:hypothetical protein